MKHRFGTQKFGFEEASKQNTLGKTTLGGLTSQMTQMSRKRDHSPSRRGPTILDRSNSPTDKKQKLETSVPVSMHGLHTEHTAADKLSEHTEEMDSDNQEDLSDDSNVTEMID